jgi:hypothetical protein
MENSRSNFKRSVIIKSKKSNDKWLTEPLPTRIPRNAGRNQNAIDTMIQLNAGELIDPAFRDENGRTPLMAASAYGFIHIVNNMLASKYFDINAKDNDGNTALILACHNYQRDIALRLLSEPDINPLAENNKGLNAMYWCHERGGAMEDVSMQIGRYMVLKAAENLKGGLRVKIKRKQNTYRSKKIKDKCSRKNIKYRQDLKLL